MISNNKHTDSIIKAKFENFAPKPPEHIWAGIEEALDNYPVVPFYRNTKVLVASVAALLALIVMVFVVNTYPYKNHDKKPSQTSLISTSIDQAIDDNVLNNEVNSDNDEESLNTDDNKVVETVLDEPVYESRSNTKFEQVSVPNNQFDEEPIVENDYVNNVSLANVTPLSDKSSIGIINLRNSLLISDVSNSLFIPEKRSSVSLLPDIEVSELKSSPSYSGFSVGYYLSPELSLTQIDSVEILNAYTFGVEPTYFFNKHWFVRSGIGVSYVRDRGFAHINYISNDYMGSYEDVYDVTFDTTSGAVIPIYHSKTVELWDSVQHVSVTNVTNKYVYLQIPLLFGYYHKNNNSQLGWYLMGGPAVNFKTTAWIDDPIPSGDDVNIISLQNNLPTRSNSYFQLWINAGIEYRLKSNLSVAIEPGFRYSLNSIYNSSYKPTLASGVTLRVGLVYEFK